MEPKPGRHRIDRDSEKERRLRVRNKRISIVIVATAITVFGLLALTRFWVCTSARGHVYSNINNVHKCRVALVLGAGIRANGKLSQSLETRVKTAIELYKAGKVEKLLMSGDNRVSHYNEPQRMCDYAVRRGVPAKDIAMDFAGRRTYDSAYRAKHIFGLNEMIVVTQPFHIGRALFLCRKVGIDAYGVEAAIDGNLKAKMRETPACLGAVIDIYVRHPRPVMGKKEKI